MSIDWFTFVAQIINFIVLVYLLNRFLYGPITQAMQKREADIASRLEEASRQQQLAAAEESRYASLSHQLEHDRNDLFEVAREESEKTRQSLVAEAQTEVQSRREDWQQSLHREHNAIIKLVRQRAGEHVVAASRGALSQLADADLEEQTLNRFLKQLRDLPTDQVERLKESAKQGDRFRISTAFEVPQKWQKTLRAAAHEQFHGEDVVFEVRHELVCGVELHAGGSKIGWSMREYLESLSDELDGMMAKEL